MFRCCLPCRGGSTAPATSPPNTPSSANEESGINLSNNNLGELNNLTTELGINITEDGDLSLIDDNEEEIDLVTSIATSSASPAQLQSSASSRHCQPQTSPLPHIEEEEEVTDSNTIPKSIEDINSSKESNSVTTSSRLKFLERCISGSGSTAGGGDEFSNSPSPRTKINRKQAKGRNRSITSTTSSETGTSSGNIVNQPSGLQLPNKMQAEQGSIGDLQKYHTRYLKNRRHTLANVR